VSGGDVLHSFPVTRSVQFSSRPGLVSSLPSGNRDLSHITSTIEGQWRDGDRFLIMTDALAHWFLRSVENGLDGVTTLECSLSDPARFQHWIDHLRESHALRNDDVTVVTVRVSGSLP